MKIKVFVFFLFFHSMVLGQNVKPFSHEKSEHCKHIYQSKSKTLDFIYNDWDYPNSVDLIYHRLELEVDPNIYYIIGKVTTYFKRSFLDETLYFDLSDSLSVDSVLYRGNKIGFAQNLTDSLAIFLPTSAPITTPIDSISIFYQGIPDSTDGRSFVQDYHGNGNPVIWTLSQPFGSRIWWPSEIGLRDKIDSLDVLITTPSAYTAVSNGLLVGSVNNGSSTTYHWKHRYPIDSYLIAFAVTNYIHISDTLYFEDGRSLPLENYVYQEDSLDWVESWGVTNAYMGWFTRLFGEYPFMNEHYGHVQFSAGGGMEHQTMSFMNSAYPPLIGHELAHQWFGNKVTTDGWQGIWLNEGLATFAEGVARENIWPQESLRWRTEYINNITSSDGGSVQVPSDSLSLSRIFNGRLSYHKGAMILNMLRWKIGDSAVFAGLRNYLNTNDAEGFGAYFYSYPNKLIDHLEDASGEDLESYFNDWYRGEGFPSYDINVKQDNGYLFIQINQSQSSPDVDFFELPLPLYVSGEGRDTTYRLEHTELSMGAFRVEVPFTIDSISFDPEKWLISANNSLSFTQADIDPLEVYQVYNEESWVINTSDPFEKLEIFYLDSKLCYEQGGTDKLVTTLNNTGWLPGVYIVRAWINGNRYAKKMIKVSQ